MGHGKIAPELALRDRTGTDSQTANEYQSQPDERAGITAQQITSLKSSSGMARTPGPAEVDNRTTRWTAPIFEKTGDAQGLNVLEEIEMSGTSEDRKPVEQIAAEHYTELDEGRRQAENGEGRVATRRSARTTGDSDNASH